VQVPANSPPSANSSSLSQRASVLCVDISVGHFDERGRSTGGRLSICFVERSSRQCLPLPASPNRRPSTPHPKMRRLRRPLSTGRSRLHASASGRYPQPAFRHSASFRHSPRAFRRALTLRISLSTDSLAADRFNESCKTDASVVSCFGCSGSKAGILYGLTGTRPGPKDRVARRVDRRTGNTAEAARL
jgi:hypothetical protein